MRREELEIDDGRLCLSVNCVGKSEIVFNPTDMGFIRKLVDVFGHLDEMQTEKDSVSTENVFDVSMDYDRKMRAEIDGILGAGVSDELFGDLNVFALSGGFPLWANLLFGILDRCEGEFAEQFKQTNPRIEKYTAKYRKK